MTRLVGKIIQRKRLICFTDTNYALIYEIFHLKDWQETGCILQTTINSKFFRQNKKAHSREAKNLQRQEIRIFNLHSYSSI